MSEQALQALNYLSKHGPSRLGTDDKVVTALTKSGLICPTQLGVKTYQITDYGEGVLRDIQRAGMEATLKKLQDYMI